MNLQPAYSSKICSSKMYSSRIYSIVFTTVACILPAAAANAQNPELQQRVAEIKQAAAANKQALAQYTWQEQETISVKGEVKKTEVYQVTIGPDGQQTKNEVSDQSASSGGRKHGLKHHVVEHVTSEYEEYGQQIAALAKQYAKPDPEKLQAAYEQHNISLQPGGGGTVGLTIKNYIKPGDVVTMVFNRQQKAIESIQVSSYLSDPSDVVKLNVQFAKLPDGTNHVTSMQVNGVTKQLTVSTQNTNYQKV
jgi:nucleoside diphosphate kinase